MPLRSTAGYSAARLSEMRFLHRWLTWLGLCAALIALAGARADAQPRPQLRLDTQSLQLAPPTGAEPTPAAAAEPATPEPAANAAEGTAPSAESGPATPPPPLFPSSSPPSPSPSSQQRAAETSAAAPAAASTSSSVASPGRKSTSLAGEGPEGEDDESAAAAAPASKTGNASLATRRAASPVIPAPTGSARSALASPFPPLPAFSSCERDRECSRTSTRSWETLGLETTRGGSSHRSAKVVGEQHEAPPLPPPPLLFFFLFSPSPPPPIAISPEGLRTCLLPATRAANHAIASSGSSAANAANRNHADPFAVIHPWSDDALPFKSAGRKISAPPGALEQSNRAAALERSCAIVSWSSRLVEIATSSCSAPEAPAAHAVGFREVLSRQTVTVASTTRLLPGARAHSMAPREGRAPGTPTAASIDSRK